MAAADRQDLARRDWLQPTDDTAPQLWLASREAGSDLPPNAPAVLAWGVVLDDAGQRFGEAPRMIANRAVQLQAMLIEIDVAETPKEIIDGFSVLAAKGSRSGFSDICQHYFNLRSQGLSREAALAALRVEQAYRTKAP
ncbi:hypothetical protein [Terrihabitans sp. B22-R8]|uniref:hypothetical protein n=1 Tax=Terrihabitans sp. B22-R8 TaxID=3425128 RepID=UPI00403D06C1